MKTFQVHGHNINGASELVSCKRLSNGADLEFNRMTKIYEIVTIAEVTSDESGIHTRIIHTN